MRWLPYFILAYVTLGLQIGLGDYVSWHVARPNLVLIAVLFVALHAPRDAALLGCFSLGLLQDLLSQHPPGLYALSYGLVAMLAVGLQHVVDRDHPLTHAGLALAGGLLTAVVIALHTWLRPPGARLADGVALPPVRGPVLPLFASAIYTALVAPGVLWVLHRFRRAFAFQGAYRKGWR
jgi:rod shape-determining protein MreD